MHKLSARWLLAFCVPALALSVFVTDPYRLSLLNLIAISAVIAASLRFVMLIGELNMAVAASMGLGAYGAGAATTMFQLPFLSSLMIGALVATIICTVFGAITLRAKGPYFMLMGFAFSEFMRILYTRSDWLGGNSGLVGIFPPKYMTAWMPTFVVVVAIILLALLFWLENLDFGRVLVGIRDNEDVVRTVGIDVTLYKILCVSIASFCAGAAGALHAFVNNVISPADFGFLVGVFALSYVKIGGESTIAGPILGSILLVLLGSYALGLGTGEHLFYGAVIVFSMLLLPGGILGLGSKWYRLAMAKRRGLSAPASPN